MQKKIYYLDHASTTKPSFDVRSDLFESLEFDWGNPSSIHRKGFEAKAILLQCEEKVKEFLGTDEGSIIWTSGGTDANIRIIQAFNSTGASFLTTPVEHKSIDQFKRNTIWPDGERFTIENFHRALSKYTQLVSMMGVNNELGLELPVISFAIWAKAFNKDLLFHTDLTAAAPCEELEPYTKVVDALTISAHKLYGPKGVGCLWVKDKEVAKYIKEFRYYGTPSVHNIVGFATAIENFNVDLENERYLDALGLFLKGLAHSIGGATVLGDPATHRGHAVCLHFEDIDAVTLVLELSDRGVLCSHGSACSSKESTRVLEAYGFSKEVAQSTVRFSFGRLCSSELDIKEVVNIIAETIKEIRNAKF